MKPFLIAALLAAGPAAAQDFSERWEVLGTFDVTVAGKDHTLYALEDLEGDTDFVNVTRTDPFTVLSVTAAALSEETGEPTDPYLTVTIGPYMEEPGNEAGVEWRADGTAWYATADSGAKASLGEIELGEDGSLAFAFDAPEMIALETDSDFNHVAVEGVPALAASGRFDGHLPEEAGK